MPLGIAKEAAGGVEIGGVNGQTFLGQGWQGQQQDESRDGPETEMMDCCTWLVHTDTLSIWDDL